MGHKIAQDPISRRIDVKEELKPRIRNYLTSTLIISMVVSYLGHFQYGYTLLLVHHPASGSFQLVFCEGESVCLLKGKRAGVCQGTKAVLRCSQEIETAGYIFGVSWLLVSNLTREEVKSLKYFWFILSPTVIFFPIGGVTGIVLFNVLVDKYGRKCLLLLNNTLAFFASVLLCISNSVHLFKFTLFANFIIGISSGIFSCCVPLYLLEVSPTPIRGFMTTTSAFFFSLGVLLGHTLGLPQVLGNKEGFPFMSIVLGLIATICILLLINCPESPRFIFIQKKNETKAREVLRSLRVQEDVGNEIRELQEEEFYEVLANEKKMTLWKFLHVAKFRWPIVTIVTLMAGSQLSGINGMFFYIEKVYMSMALPRSISDIISSGIHVIIIITVVVTINLVEEWGRRLPLIMGFMICSMTCILLTFTLEFQEQNYIIAFLSLVLIITFLIGHMLGPGPIRLVVLGELFLQSTRATAFTVGYSALWFTRFVSGMILIQLELLLGPYSLLVYWPFCVATFIYLFKMLPETRGKTFVEIQLAIRENK